MCKMASLVGLRRQKLCPQMIIHQAHSGNELCCHIVKPLTIASPDSFHSIEDNGERDGYQSTQDDMILSNSIVNLNKLFFNRTRDRCSFLLDKESESHVAQFPEVISW